MGVRGLQCYLEQHCPTASCSVSLPELLKRKYRGDGQPTIVVDGLTCSHILYEDLEWIGGGQLNQLKEKSQQFVDAFRKIGVHLIFFFDGLTEGRKRRTWVDRRMQKLESVYYVLDAISEGERANNIDRSKHFIKPPGMGQICRDVFDIECGCEVYQSLAECDEEIADYAKRHGAFAILAQDTDFVILDGGGALYLSMQHLNLLTMTTRHYDCRALANHLGIDLSHLPLLATLMGNDIISFKDLKNFHYQLLQKNPFGRIDYQKLVPAIAMFIRYLPTNEDLLLPKLSVVSQKALGDHSRHQEILTSIRSYSNSPRREVHDSSKSEQWTKVLGEARQRHVTNKFSSMIYAIMKDQTFESGTIMEDYRKNDLPFFAAVTQPMRKRLYGILLQDKDLQPGQMHKVEEWCMAGPNSLDRPNIVVVEPPPQRHPGLLALWENDDKNMDIRWQLFVHSVSPQLNVNQLRKIPAHLVIPTMTLFFISNHLNSWEVDAVLVTSSILKHYDTAKLARLPPEPLSPRGIRLSSLIMQITFILHLLLAACGYPLSKKETAPWTFFDGKLFQAKYTAARSGASHSELCEHLVGVEKDFKMSRQVIMN